MSSAMLVQVGSSDSQPLFIVVLQGNWNKLTMLRRVMNSTPREVADWIMWMDSDTVLFNTSVSPLAFIRKPNLLRCRIPLEFAAKPTGSTDWCDSHYTLK
jgi:hypothetical protein